MNLHPLTVIGAVVQLRPELPTCKQDAHTVPIGSGLIPEEHTCVLFEQRQHCVILAVLETRRACLCRQPVGPFFTFTLHALWGLLA